MMHTISTPRGVDRASTQDRVAHGRKVFGKFAKHVVPRTKAAAKAASTAFTAFTGMANAASD